MLLLFGGDVVELLPFPSRPLLPSFSSADAAVDAVEAPEMHKAAYRPSSTDARDA